jgi:hypothetical protein
MRLRTRTVPRVVSPRRRLPLLALLAACSGGAEEPFAESGGSDAGSVEVTYGGAVNGHLVAVQPPTLGNDLLRAYRSAIAQRLSSGVVLLGASVPRGDSVYSLMLDLPAEVRTPGTYQVGGHFSVATSITAPPTRLGFSAFTAQGVTLTLTGVSRTRLRGTFTATLRSTRSDAAPGDTLRLTNGQFDVSVYQSFFADVFGASAP